MRKAGILSLLILLYEILFSSNLDFSIKSNNGFTPNLGQISNFEGKRVGDIIFYTIGKGFSVFVRNNGVSYVIYGVERKEKPGGNVKGVNLRQNDEVKIHYARVDVEFEGASFKLDNVEFLNPLPGYTNYYYDHCPNGILFVPSYSEVKVKGIYPGVDWIWKYENEMLHHEFFVRNSSDVDKIRFKVKYADLEIRDGKRLFLKTPLGEIEDGELIAYDVSKSKKVDVRYNFDGKMVKFEVKDEISGPVLIDPMLSLLWGTYYGGSLNDFGNSITTDASGNIFITGYTNSSTDFPTQDPGGGAYFQGTIAGGFDAFILKFDNSGVRQWATYYGGSSYDEASSIAVDANGNVFVTGYTQSTNFPTQDAGGGAYFQGTNAGEYDAFILKFNNSGVRQWATYYGGNYEDLARSIEVDANGNVFVVGCTYSTNFPTQNPGGGSYFQGTNVGGCDAFILKFNNNGARQWATYYGGSSYDEASSIAVDANGNVFVTGYTQSTNFPTQDAGGGAYFQGTNAGGYDAFILKFNNSGVRQWATYYGGNYEDRGCSITPDANGNIFVTGYTQSTNFPTQDPGGGAYFQGTNAGGYDAFILKFNNSGVRQWATYYGGNHYDYAYSITMDANGNVFVTGQTYSSNFPTQDFGGGAYYQGSKAGGYDVFILGFANSGVRGWATYYGGYYDDKGYAIAVDHDRNIFVTGTTSSNNLPLQNPGGGAYYQGSNAGNSDVFILKFEGVPLDYSLPVQSAYLSGMSDNSKITLVWETRSEINNAGFEIFRKSEQENDYKLIASYLNDDSLKGLGTSSYGKRYTYVDYNVKQGVLYKYKIYAVSFNGHRQELGIVFVKIEIPSVFVLYQNYPNPFNSGTQIEFDLPESDYVKLEVFNLIGEKVAVINVGYVEAGYRRVVKFEDNKLPSGVYFYKLTAGKYSDVKKMVLIK